MASDEIVWQVINQQFCAYKLKATKGQNFCRNEYNVTGLCNRMSCPLANSNYATIRADPVSGVLYLYIKVVERAHLPSKLWERIQLSANYTKALAQIDEHLLYWPEFLTHKCKQRLTRLTQVAIKTKRLAKEAERLGEQLVPRLAPKVRRREEGRERKAEIAAKVDRVIERELLERLRSGAYGDRPLNVEERIWERVLRGLERKGEGIRDVDLDEGIELEEREVELEHEPAEVEYVSELEGESGDDLESLDGWFEGGSGEEEELSDDGESAAGGNSDTGPSDVSEDGRDEAGATKKPSGPSKRKRPPPMGKPRRKMARVEIEYEARSAPPLHLAK